MDSQTVSYEARKVNTVLPEPNYQVEKLPSYQAVLDVFSKNVIPQGLDSHAYLPFDGLLDEWNKTRNSDGFDMETLVQFVAKYSINTKSPYYLAKLCAGSDSLSLLADMLISYYNTNVHVYSVSPVFTLTEHLMIQRLSNLIDNTGYGYGLFLPGGSYCNTMGIIAAKHWYNPETKVKGVDSTSSMITSQRCHYSIDKSAIMSGVGINRCIKVDYDTVTYEQMEELIVKNNVFCVCATFGTTCEGVQENLERFYPLFKKHRVWHHVDACVMGPLIYSSKYEHLTKHLKQADSISLDLHKVANVAVQCSCVMIKQEHEGVLNAATDVHADYLFHSGDEVCHDIGNMSFQCGRKGDALRLFVYDSMMNMGDRIDHFVNRVDYCRKIITADERYTEHMIESNMSHIMFTPQSFYDLKYTDDQIHDMIAKIVRQMRDENIFLEYFRHFFRIVPVNPMFERAQFAHILERIAFWQEEFGMNNKENMSNN